jgi:hypothetical protein
LPDWLLNLLLLGGLPASCRRCYIISKKYKTNHALHAPSVCGFHHFSIAMQSSEQNEKIEKILDCELQATAINSGERIWAYSNTTGKESGGESIWPSYSNAPKPVWASESY